VETIGLNCAACGEVLAYIFPKQRAHTHVRMQARMRALTCDMKNKFTYHHRGFRRRAARGPEVVHHAGVVGRDLVGEHSLFARSHRAAAKPGTKRSGGWGRGVPARLLATRSENNRRVFGTQAKVWWQAVGLSSIVDNRSATNRNLQPQRVPWPQLQLLRNPKPRLQVPLLLQLRSPMIPRVEGSTITTPSKVHGDDAQLSLQGACLLELLQNVCAIEAFI
jgi:hypothetical protein